MDKALVRAVCCPHARGAALPLLLWLRARARGGKVEILKIHLFRVGRNSRNYINTPPGVAPGVPTPCTFRRALRLRASRSPLSFASSSGGSVGRPRPLLSACAPPLCALARFARLSASFAALVRFRARFASRVRSLRSSVSRASLARLASVRLSVCALRARPSYLASISVRVRVCAVLKKVSTILV